MEVNPMVFSRLKPIALEVLSPDERAESEALLQSLDYRAVIRTDGIEAARQRYRAYLSERLLGQHQTHAEKVWMYLYLGVLYETDRMLKESIAVYSRAAKLYPADPRSHYAMGVTYYGKFITSLWMPDSRTEEGIAGAPLEVQEQHRNSVFHQDPELALTYREADLGVSVEEAGRLALTLLRRTLACALSDDDKQAVQGHIRRIEVELTEMSRKTPPANSAGVRSDSSSGSKPISSDVAAGRKQTDRTLTDPRETLKTLNHAIDDVELIAPGWVALYPSAMSGFAGAERIVSRLLELENDPNAYPKNLAMLKEAQSDLKILSEGGMITPAARTILCERLKLLASTLAASIERAEGTAEGD
jgi:tetratricopeptide (TPR) repeat protein